MTASRVQCGEQWQGAKPRSPRPALTRSLPGCGVRCLYGRASPRPKGAIGRQVVGLGGVAPKIPNQPDRRSPGPRGGEQSQAYHFRPRRAVEIRGFRGSRDTENVQQRPSYGLFIGRIDRPTPRTMQMPVRFHRRSDQRLEKKQSDYGRDATCPARGILRDERKGRFAFRARVGGRCSTSCSGSRSLKRCFFSFTT